MIRIRFWGTRGSITSPGLGSARYGGNTACVQVTAYDQKQPGAAYEPGCPQVILDGGTGLAVLQREIMAGPARRGRGRLHLLLSHYHWDHLIGLPFFAPLFVQGNQVTLHGPNEQALRESIQRLFTSVYSPIQGAQNLAADLGYEELPTRETELAGFSTATVPNSHPGGSVSIRLAHGSRRIVYSTDHEAGDPDTDRRLIEFARGAHVWILDAQYTPEESRHHKGWGHSSYQDAVRLALEAQVHKLVLFHHDPDHDDRTLDRFGMEASAAADGRMEVLVARDGMILEV